MPSSAASGVESDSSFALDVLARLSQPLVELQLASPVVRRTEQRQQQDGAAAAASGSTAEEDDYDDDAEGSLTASLSTSALSTPNALLRILDQLGQQQTAQQSRALGSVATADVELARVAAATAALVLDALLRDARSRDAAAWAWDEVANDDWRATWYLVQTLPSRLTALGKLGAHMARRTLAHSNPTAATQSVFSRDVLSSALHTLLASPLLVRQAMFPLSSGKAFNELSESDDAAAPRRRSAKGGKRAGQMLLSALKHASPLRLTTHEAGAKRKHALKERDALAARLGGLALALTPAHDASSPRTPSSPTLQARNAASPALRTSLEEQVVHLAHAIEIDAASAQQEDVRSTLRSVLLRLSENSSRAGGALSLSPALRPAPVGLGPPTFLARAWPTLVLGPVAGVVLLRIATRNWDAVRTHLRDARETVRGFVIGWVWEPVRGLLETVRHGDQEGMIITKESLRSDVSSLERMVVDFSKELYGMDDEQLKLVASRVRDGDLSEVLRIYEKELKSPVKSAVTGSLVRSLLIQIQKGKVDLETAMAGIDRLLKSQQLLFGAVGVAPAMGVVYLFVSWTRGKVAEWAGRKGKQMQGGTRTQVWEAMRRIDALLLAAPSSQPGLSPKTYGLLLLDLSLLRASASSLTSAPARGHRGAHKRLRTQFLDDVRALEAASAADSSALDGRGSASTRDEPGIGWMVRRASVERMWRSWGPLFALVGTQN